MKLHLRFSTFLFLLTISFGFLAGGVAACAGSVKKTDTPEGKWSSTQCVAMTGDDPFGARDYAQDWMKHNGGRDARRCLALAQMATGDETSAAKTLDDLARNSPPTGSDTSDVSRAAIASEAAQAWLAASQPANAMASAEYGLSLNASDVELQLLRARAQIVLGHFNDVMRDLGALIIHQPDSGAEVYTLLASAERREGQLRQAQVHIARAIAIDPEDSAVLLERGIIRGQSGDFSGARSDWQQVIDLAPDTHDADLARQDLAVQAADPDIP